jgi:hypothetical protein
MIWTKENTDTLIRLRFERRKWAEISEMIEGTTPVSCSHKYKRISKEDKIPKPVEVESENVLVIGDPHVPFIKAGYLDFCLSIYKKYNCSKVVIIGDLLDNHAGSFHESDPDGMSAGDELSISEKMIYEMYSMFPKALVCLGNHDLIPDRKAFSAGISKKWIKRIDEILELPNWTFSDEFLINGVLYTHGTGRKARQRCIQEFTSIVQGHYHSDTYYETFVSEHKLMFALQVGCGIDRRSYAMAYGKHFKKPQLNCGVVLDNGRWALIEHMKLD